MDLSFMAKVFNGLFQALPLTLQITLIPFAAALIIALIVSTIVYYKIPVLNIFAMLYVSFFRSTPLIGQIFLIYFGLPKIFPSLASFSSETFFIVALSLNTGAYVSEVIRGAILSIDKGQIEAAKMIGLGRILTMKNIIIPQAIPVATPALVNNLIDTIKGSSLAFTIGIIDITAQAKIIAGKTYQYFEAYVALVLFYWILIVILERIQKTIEKKTKRQVAS